MEDITQEKFDAFLEVRDSGVTNMFDSAAVIVYAKEMSDVQLTREEVKAIISNFDELNEKFGNK